MPGATAPSRSAGAKRLQPPRSPAGTRIVQLEHGESEVFALLLTLAEHAGRVMSRDALMDTVKGEPIEALDRSIDVQPGLNLGEVENVID